MSPWILIAVLGWNDPRGGMTSIVVPFADREPCLKATVDIRLQVTQQNKIRGNWEATIVSMHCYPTGGGQ